MADANPYQIDPKRSRLQFRLFLCSNFVYLWLVHWGALWLYPLGTDYARLADPASLGFVCGRVLNAQMQVFGDWLPGYHAFNFLLLYGAMLAVLLLTRFVLNGPWWLGSFAAVLMMANPAKNAAVLPLSAVADLLPAVSALAALACYAGYLRHGGRVVYVASLLLFAAASLAFTDNLMLFGAVLVFDLFIGGGDVSRSARLAPFVAVFAGAMARHGWVWVEYPMDPVAAFAPLYLALYPLGLLPGTAVWYAAYPVLWLVPAVIFGVIVWRIYRVTREPGLLAALLAAIAFRSMPAGDFDFVHLWGGGQLIVPIALMNVAHASVWMHVQRHPRWKRAAVTLTTSLCIVFFVMQWREIWQWDIAGKETQTFQQRAAEAAAAEPGAPIAVLPAYGYRGTIPVWIAESAAFDTPFSQTLPVNRYLRMHAFSRDAVDVEIQEWSELGAVVRVQGQPAYALFGVDWAQPAVGEEVAFPDYLLRFEAVADNDYTLRIFPVDSLMPPFVVRHGNRGAGLAPEPGEVPGAAE
ncbi:MAG: hypothetical protein GC168_11700 [Candidatus Hydrogenedens sp.]|nr:hypothetical protein [Candidatus Hydrogenedens sp.]